MASVDAAVVQYTVRARLYKLLSWMHNSKVLFVVFRRSISLDGHISYLELLVTVQKYAHCF